MTLTRLGRYDLIRVVGVGSMGTVYEGRDPNLDRRVAIKTIRMESLSKEELKEYEFRFRTEARSAARLQHPNIVSVYDSDRDGDTAYLVLEYVQGDDIKHHFDQGKRFNLSQTLGIMRDLLMALGYAHEQNVVHRDVKPANLLMEASGRIKLTDFGVARMQDAEDHTRTRGSVVGTLKYMAPEQVLGAAIDARADLFAAGVVLYQLITSRRPFDGDNDYAVSQQILDHTPVAPTSLNPRLPVALDLVIAKALAKPRDGRFATAQDFLIALQNAVAQAPDLQAVPLLKVKVQDTLPPILGLANPLSAPRPMPSAFGGLTSPGIGGNSAVLHELELVYWKDVKESGDPEDLNGFLVRFPEGVYADLARRRLRKIFNLQNGIADASNISYPDLSSGLLGQSKLDEASAPLLPDMQFPLPSASSFAASFAAPSGLSARAAESPTVNQLAALKAVFQSSAHLPTSASPSPSSRPSPVRAQGAPALTAVPEDASRVLRQNADTAPMTLQPDIFPPSLPEPSKPKPKTKPKFQPDTLDSSSRREGANLRDDTSGSRPRPNINRQPSGKRSAESRQAAAPAGLTSWIGAANSRRRALLYGLIVVLTVIIVAYAVIVKSAITPKNKASALPPDTLPVATPVPISVPVPVPAESALASAPAATPIAGAASAPVTPVTATVTPTVEAARLNVLTESSLPVTSAASAAQKAKAAALSKSQIAAEKAKLAVSASAPAAGSSAVPAVTISQANADSAAKEAAEKAAQSAAAAKAAAAAKEAAALEVRTPVAPPASVATAPKSTDPCEGRVLIGHDWCMTEHCAKPAFAETPLCRERREIVRKRKERDNF